MVVILILFIDFIKKKKNAVVKKCQIVRVKKEVS